MANPDRWQVRWRVVAMTFCLQTMISLPLLAETTPSTIVDGQSSMPPLLRIALAPPATGTAPSSRTSMNGSALRNNLDEARAVLEDLRFFADTARRAIEMGRKIAALRLENKELKQNLAKTIDGRHDLDSSLVAFEAKSVLLTRTVLAHWLISERLRQDEAEKDAKLSSAKAAWIETAGRLNALKRQLVDHHDKARNLRAKTAALAAEIGRTRRAIINLEEEARLLDADRQTVQVRIRQLRHGISTRLRTILLSH